jgi:hypothetical protein
LTRTMSINRNYFLSRSNALRGIHSSLPDGSINLAAVMAQYQTQYFDPATQTFLQVPVTDQIQQTMSYIVPDQWVNNNNNLSTPLLSTFVWTTDSNAWCPTSVKCPGEAGALPACECLRARIERLVGLTEFNNCEPCLASGDTGCLCWARLLQYRQLLEASPCYVWGTGVYDNENLEFVRGLITYPCRTEQVCYGPFQWISNSIATCVDEIQICREKFVASDGFTCYA